MPVSPDLDPDPDPNPYSEPELKTTKVTVNGQTRTRKMTAHQMSDLDRKCHWVPQT